jgi:hypothetical protein
MVKIHVRELRRITEAIYRQLEATGQSEVELTADYYWNIPADRLYEIEAPLEDSLDQGQLSSDWEELTEVGKGQGPVPSYDLAHLAAVMRFVATKVI